MDDAHPIITVGTVVTDDGEPLVSIAVERQRSGRVLLSMDGKSLALSAMECHALTMALMEASARRTDVLIDLSRMEREAGLTRVRQGA